MGVCDWGVSAAPPRSWLGCWVVCFGVCAPPVHRQSWRGVRCGCVCLGSSFGCAPPFLSGIFWACAFMCALRLYPAIPGSGVLGWVRVLGFGFRLRPAFPGWSVWLCALVSALGLYPANPSWGVRCGCVCLGSGFGLRPAISGWCFRACVFVCTLRLYPAIPGSDVR